MAVADAGPAGNHSTVVVGRWIAVDHIDDNEALTSKCCVMRCSDDTTSSRRLFGRRNMRLQQRHNDAPMHGAHDYVWCMPRNRKLTAEPRQQSRRERSATYTNLRQIFVGQRVASLLRRSTISYTRLIIRPNDRSERNSGWEGLKSLRQIRCWSTREEYEHLRHVAEALFWGKRTVSPKGKHHLSSDISISGVIKA